MTHIVRATPDGGLQVLSLASGKGSASAGGTGVAGPGDLVYPYESQVFVAGGGAGVRLRAYGRGSIGTAQWTWT